MVQRVTPWLRRSRPLQPASRVLSQAHEDLARIPQLRARLERKLGDTQQWLSSTVYSQVQEMKEGLDLITAMGTTLADLHATFRRIEELCGESSELMDEHERLELLSVTRENLQKLQADVQGILSIPFEAAAVEAALGKQEGDLLMGLLSAAPAAQCKLCAFSKLLWAFAKLRASVSPRRSAPDGSHARILGRGPAGGRLRGTSGRVGRALVHPVPGREADPGECPSTRAHVDSNLASSCYRQMLLLHMAHCAGIEGVEGINLPTPASPHPRSRTSARSRLCRARCSSR